MPKTTGQAPKTSPPGEREKNADAVERGRSGGQSGGKMRATRPTASDRSEAAVEPPRPAGRKQKPRQNRTLPSRSADLHKLGNGAEFNGLCLPNPVILAKVKPSGKPPKAGGKRPS
jgi:hypothetical protein